MKTITKPTYECDHCKKLYKNKGWCEKHEVSCKKNPANYRPCFDCQHCEKVQTTHYFDTYVGEGRERVNVLKCNAKGTYLIPPKAEHKGNRYEFGDIENDTMPLKCAIFDEYYAILLNDNKNGKNGLPF